MILILESGVCGVLLWVGQFLKGGSSENFLEKMKKMHNHSMKNN